MVTMLPFTRAGSPPSEVAQFRRGSDQNHVAKRKRPPASSLRTSSLALIGCEMRKKLGRRHDSDTTMIGIILAIAGDNEL